MAAWRTHREGDGGGSWEAAGRGRMSGGDDGSGMAWSKREEQDGCLGSGVTSEPTGWAE